MACSKAAGACSYSLKWLNLVRSELSTLLNFSSFICSSGIMVLTSQSMLLSLILKSFSSEMVEETTVLGETTNLP